MCVPWFKCGQRSEDSIQELVLSFQESHSALPACAARKRLPPLSDLTSPRVERKLSFPEDRLMCLATLLPRIFWYSHRPTSFLPLSIKDRLWPRYYSQTHRTGSEKKEVRGKKGRGKRALMTQNCIACMLLSPFLALPKQESKHGPPRAVGLKSLPHCKPRL